jgi:hypothetical protein
MRFIRDWLKNEHALFAEDVLADLRKFIITVNDSSFLDALVLEVVQGIHDKVCTGCPSFEMFSNVFISGIRQLHSFVFHLII